MMKRVLLIVFIGLYSFMCRSETVVVDEFSPADTSDTSFWRTSAHALTVTPVASESTPTVLTAGTSVASGGESLDTNPFSFLSSLATSLNALSGLLLIFR